MTGDVLILGGGLAGAAAALALADRGIAVTLVEARGRLGGRAFSRPLGGTVVEYGGAWGAERHGRLKALAARLGIGLTPRAPLARRLYLRGGALHEAPDAALGPALARWQADLADPAALAMPLADWFRTRQVPTAAREEILAWWAISGASDPALGAVGQLLTTRTAGGFGPKLDELAFTITGGVQRLAEAAIEASGAEVLLSDPAERLTQDGGGARLRLASGRELAARAALVALPLNALDQLRFDPPLPAAPERLRRKGHAGRVVKYLIRAEGIAPGTLVTGLAEGLRFFWADHLARDGTAVVVAFGLSVDVPLPSEAHARAALALAFPGARFVAADWHDWVTDPFARGVWVGPRAEDEDLHDPAHWRPFGRLAFAGSDIGPLSEQGWFEGAILSGEAAAADLAALLGREPPSRP